MYSDNCLQSLLLNAVNLIQTSEEAQKPNIAPSMFSPTITYIYILKSSPCFYAPP